ncbi:MAG: lipoyl(octanoyl) transferase LipB [Gammaproteobacteria bacterium]|nr:lipoyl(octanoyl) transferase LipB [Gammaproteobacteria bacterium]MBT3489203.1 lipoyl(octanoyl) transferase LipB [Gammaproteobacteria bacterium]MBT3719543.1 lipoyl(octanoyl) transferase LipB [Gammaproteobacteria bacterium]MBT3845374.1 lipoyl(octanoyl) transferase LipB [Gammaproteobacteria bacterium]MBT3892488.1 lipoyl(octanoyl) transferase LipB [Gammaproteobacteria bacterium]
MIILRQLGQVPYQPTWHQMQQFTEQRTAETADELWLLQHPPTFTQGRAGKTEHLLDPGEIPVIPIDRGGQVTYHGPGQLVLYTLIDLQRRKLGVRALVTALEQTIIVLLREHYGIDSEARKEAPGVYVAGAKIAAIGLRIRKGCSFHGLSFNLKMDLEPFQRINPCGYQGLQVTQLSDLTELAAPSSIHLPLIQQLLQQLGYNPADLHIA